MDEKESVVIDSSKLSAEVISKYTLTNNALKMVAKDNPKDRIEAIIGDDKQPDTFYPQVKIQRWDNEVNTSVRLKDDGLEKETVTTDKEKIVWSKGTKEVHFYDIQDDKHPEGAYELEVILKERPKSNVVEFTIQTKGLIFVRQRPLNEKGYSNEYVTTETEVYDREGHLIEFIPENVVGSYVMWTETPKINIEGQKVYGTGKVGDIFRPKIYDSAGESVWGILRIENNILEITIPQEFLDRALYPIVVDPTFGYETIGSGNYGMGTLVIGSDFPSGGSGDVTKISGYFYYAGYNIQAAIYDSSLNHLAHSSTVSSSASTTVTDFTLSQSITDTTYYLLAQVQTSGQYFKNTDFGEVDGIYKSGITFGTWPNITGQSGAYNMFSIYATYTAEVTNLSINKSEAITVTDTPGVSVEGVRQPLSIVQAGLDADADLEGYWPLDDALDDLGPNNYDLTAENSPSYATGQFNNGMAFVRDSLQYLTTSTSANNLNTTGAQTWSYWLKPTSDTTRAGAMSIFQAGTGERKLWIDGSLDVYARINGISTETLGPVDIGAVNEWHHVAMVYDPTNGKFKMFVNGAKTEANVTGTPTTLTTNQMTFAQDNGSQGHNCVMDDIAFFSRALTDAEIADIHNGLYEEEGGTALSVSIVDSKGVQIV